MDRWRSCSIARDGTQAARYRLSPSRARGVSFLIGRELKAMTIGLVNRDRMVGTWSSITDEILFGFSLQTDGRMLPIEVGGVKQRYIGEFLCLIF
jgi:hypothetical protein